MIHWSPLMLVTACLFWAVALVFLGNSLGKAHSRLIAVKVLPPMQHSPLTAHRSPLSPPPLHRYEGDSYVLFSDVRYGEIGSTSGPGAPPPPPACPGGSKAECIKTCDDPARFQLGPQPS